MINNKGFSMVELLATIVILGILSSIAIVAVANILDRAHEEYYNNQEKNLVLAAQAYYNANTTKLPKVIGKKDKVTAMELKTANYLKKALTTYDGKTSCDLENSYVIAFKYSKSNYSYTPYLTCGKDRTAKELEKEGQPKIGVSFPEDNAAVSKAKVVINIKGEESGDTKILSYSYILYVIKDGKSIELVNSGNKASNQTEVFKTISLKEYALSGKAKLKVKVTATNIKGNSKSIVKTNIFDDNKPPTCQYVDEKDNPTSPNRRTNWVKENVKVTIKCYDDDGSGCEKEYYTKTFVGDGEFDYIKIKDNAGNHNDCKVVKLIDNTPPRDFEITGYKRKDSNTVTSSNGLDKHKSNVWVNGYLFVKPSAIDDGVGGIKYYPTTSGLDVNLNGTNPNKYINVDKQGVVNIKYKACDALNNCTNQLEYISKLDRENPIVTIATAANNTQFSATATDNLGIEKANWGNSATTKINISTTYSAYRSRVYTIDGSNLCFYAADQAGNIGNNCHPTYKLYSIPINNSDGRVYVVGDVKDSDCSKNAKYTDGYEGKPWKKYEFNIYSCNCTFDYYFGTFYSYNGFALITGPNGINHKKSQMVNFFQSSDNGVDSCKHNRNSYIYDVCLGGDYVKNSNGEAFHGYRWYSGAVPAGGFANWGKKQYYHNYGDYDNRVPYGSSMDTACIHTCQVAANLQKYAH